MKKLIGALCVVLVLLALGLDSRSQNMFRKVNDFDGDGRSDYAVTRNVGGAKVWYIWQSTAGFRAFQYGFDTDENVAGDYDGDGKTDIAVFRQQPGSPASTWYQFWFSGSLVGEQAYFRLTNAYPNVVAHHQDYDGDGKTDIAWTIEDNARYFVVYSLGGTNGVNNPGGNFVKIGDMTGDNKAETAAYDSSNVVRMRDAPFGGNTQSVQFGAPGDQYVPADFDGDGKGDLTIFRPQDGAWWWIRSSDSVVNVAGWGQNGDTPVPGDYDNDGKTDLAIYRPGPQSYYWVIGSQNGVSVFPWGVTGDQVVRY